MFAVCCSAIYFVVNLVIYYLLLCLSLCLCLCLSLSLSISLYLSLSFSLSISFSLSLSLSLSPSVSLSISALSLSPIMRQSRGVLLQQQSRLPEPVRSRKRRLSVVNVCQVKRRRLRKNISIRPGRQLEKNSRRLVARKQRLSEARDILVSCLLLGTCCFQLGPRRVFTWIDRNLNSLLSPPPACYFIVSASPMWCRCLFVSLLNV